MPDIEPGTPESKITAPLKTPVLSADADEPSGEGWDDSTKAYVAKLRGENKQRRLEADSLKEKTTKLETEFNEITGKLKSVLGGGDDEDEEYTPAQKVELLTHEIEARDAHIAFMESSLALGITDPKDRKYFQFLLDDHMSEQEDGYELPDDVLDELVGQVRQRSQLKGPFAGGTTSFSNGKTPPTREGSGEISVAQFMAMKTTERGALYGKNPELYNRLLAESKTL